MRTAFVEVYRPEPCRIMGLAVKTHHQPELDACQFHKNMVAIFKVEGMVDNSEAIGVCLAKLAGIAQPGFVDQDESGLTVTLVGMAGFPRVR